MSVMECIDVLTPRLIVRRESLCTGRIRGLEILLKLNSIFPHL